jgi:hypothetical protein
MSNSTETNTTNTQNLNNTTVTTAYKKYGVHKSIATYISNNMWNIPHEFADLFQTYYLLHWEKEHFFKSLSYGTIVRKDTEYSVIYHDCTLWDIKKLDCDVQLKLSFRELQDEYKYVPIVLLTIKK